MIEQTSTNVYYLCLPHNLRYSNRLRTPAKPIQKVAQKCIGSLPSPVVSMREATFTVSPKRQYLGIACPTTPV